MSICEELKLEEPVITNNQTLRLEEHFGTQISFHSVARPRSTLVYSSDTNPCDYAVATLHGCGLRDDDFVRAFGRMVKQKVKRDPTKKKMPLMPDDLVLS